MSIEHLHLIEMIARAGGGHAFGGGGSHYGGGSSGGGSYYGGGGYYGGGYGSGFGGGLGGIGLLLALLAGGLPLLLLVIVISAAMRAFTRGSRPMPPAAQWDDSRPVGAPQTTGEALEGTAVGAAGGALEEGLAEIRSHDPGFDDGVFVTRVERVFFIVQQAWMELKPEMSRQVMADGIWQQHRAQMEGYRSRNQRNLMDGLAVGRVTLLAAHSDQRYDTITARILAASADYDVDAATGKVVRGDRTVRQWSEDWLFQRASTATTRPDGGTMEQRCPNCGAPLDVDLAGVCGYCHAPIMGGAYDWVLSRIDQIS